MKKSTHNRIILYASFKKRSDNDRYIRYVDHTVYLSLPFSFIFWPCSRIFPILADDKNTLDTYRNLNREFTKYVKKKLIYRYGFK
jgi:hypothetical protein